MTGRGIVVASLAAGGAATVHVAAAASFRRRTQALVGRLGHTVARDGEDAPMPALVRRFAKRAGPEPGTHPLVRLCQCAEMRAGPDDAWRKVMAEQTISVHEPGFVWAANMKLAPLLRVRILDAYVNGQGFLEARLFGSVRLARAAGPQLNKSELMRYLAELAWAPQAILSNPHLRWREIDAGTVEVSADSDGGPARVRLGFRDGDITRIEADDRPRMIGRRTVSTPWLGRFFDYRELGGWRIPTRAEVSWIAEGRAFPVWRGAITRYAAA